VSLQHKVECTQYGNLVVNIAELSGGGAAAQAVLWWWKPGEDVETGLK
jgi:hypothetical protein